MGTRTFSGLNVERPLVIWKVFSSEFVIELMARTQTEALLAGAELLAISPCNLKAIRVYDW